MADKLKVLVVEDEPAIRRLIVEVLKKNSDYQVEGAIDGLAAWQFLEKLNFEWDIVLTDMQMPRMGGYDFLVKLHEAAPKIACVVLTAYKNDTYVVKCLEMGVHDYVLKPISVIGLQQTIKAVADRVRSACGNDKLELRSEMQGWVEITAPNDFEYVERFRKFTSLLGNTPLDEQAKADLRIAIDELGQNAVEWGNREDRSKKVHLSYCIFKDRMVFKIEDEGEGFDPKKLGDPSVDPLKHIMSRVESGKRPGGYGIHITKQIMDDIVYNEKGNIVVMSRFFKHTGGNG